MKKKPKYATAQRDGYDVPLIGIPASAQEDGCDGCKRTFPLSKLTYTGERLLCASCLSEGGQKV